MSNKDIKEHLLECTRLSYKYRKLARAEDAAADWVNRAAEKYNNAQRIYRSEVMLIDPEDLVEEGATYTDLWAEKLVDAANDYTSALRRHAELIDETISVLVQAQRANLAFDIRINNEVGSIKEENNA